MARTDGRMKEEKVSGEEHTSISSSSKVLKQRPEVARKKCL